MLCLTQNYANRASRFDKSLRHTRCFSKSWEGEGVRATRMGSSAVVPRVSAADASHIGAISLSSIGLVICRSASAIPFPESIHAAKTSSRRASKPGVVTRSEPEAVLDPIPRYKFFSLAPDAGSDPSDYSQHLEGLAKAGRLMSKGGANRRPGLFPRPAG